MEIIEKRVKDLIPYTRNPRRNDDAVEYVANSIANFGFKVPIVIDNKNVIVAGHTRLKAAKKLGLKTLPCVVADDLTDEQIAAFRLADNKTAEAAEWDIELLASEIAELSNFDFTEFGFTYDDGRQRAKATNFTDRDEDPLPRLQHNTFDNFERDFTPEYCGKYDIPVMKRTDTTGEVFARYCDWKEIEDPENTIVHSYYDDYKFINMWRDPDCYLENLLEYKAVVAPDFSLYTDFPLALQIMSCYKRQWIGAYWQSLGIDVIPDVVWGEPKSYEFCFDGIPQGGTVAVSTVGVKKDPEWNGEIGNLFRDGYNEMLRRINPDTIIFYGDMIDGLEGNIIRIPSYYEEKRKRLDGRAE